MSPTEITIPYLDLSDHRFADLTLLTQDQKWRLLDRLLAEHGYQRTDIPAAWSNTPLAAWCWLILTLNDIDHDATHHQPLDHWGIDLTFTSHDVRLWIWTLA